MQECREKRCEECGQQQAASHLVPAPSSLPLERAGQVEGVERWRWGEWSGSECTLKVEPTQFLTDWSGGVRERC